MTSRSLSLFDLAPGKVLQDRYSIRRPNRQGGIATTFEVEDLAQDAVRELQVFPAALFESSAQANEFGEVVGRWKEVSAPSVLATREAQVLEDGTVLLVTDLPAGEPLRSWLETHGHASPARTADIGLQLLAGLESIHAAGLVHGDIKPSTIFVQGKEPRVTLVDGGITPALWRAKHLGERTALIGTPFYAPIEQFGGDAPDVQSDIYNLATVLFELATGVLPWKGKSFLEVFQAKLEKTPPSMKACAPKVKVPQALEEAVAAGLMTDKRQRYASAEAFRSRLAAVAGS
jgi:serine/threonine-protein kinase